jgi:mRNA interferase ChpB
MALLWVEKFCNRYNQPRVLDITARGGKKVDVLPSEILDEVMAKVVTIFE